MPLYPIRALERAMKIKEVITRAMGGLITWMQAAEIIGITDRSMRRWRKRLGTGGYEALLDRRRRRPSAKRIDIGRLSIKLCLRSCQASRSKRVSKMALSWSRASWTRPLTLYQRPFSNEVIVNPSFIFRVSSDWK